MKRALRSFAVASCLLAFAAGAAPLKRGKITGLRVRASESGSVVEVQADRPLSFTTLRLAAPPRVVLDFPDAEVDGAPREQEIEDGTVRRVGAAAVGSRTARVVIELSAEAEFDVRAVGPRLDVRIPKIVASERVAVTKEARPPATVAAAEPRSLPSPSRLAAGPAASAAEQQAAAVREPSGQVAAEGQGRAGAQQAAAGQKVEGEEKAAEEEATAARTARAQAVLDAEQKQPAEKAAAAQVEAERLAAEKLAAEQRAAETLAAEKLAAEKLAAEKLAAEKLAAEKLAAEKLAAEKLAAEKLAAEKLDADKLAAEKLAAEKLAAEKVAAEKLAANQAAEQRAAETKRLAQQRAEEERQAAEGRAAAERQAALQQTTERQAAAEQAEAARQGAERAAAEHATTAGSAPAEPPQVAVPGPEDDPRKSLPTVSLAGQSHRPRPALPQDAPVPAAPLRVVASAEPHPTVRPGHDVETARAGEPGRVSITGIGFRPGGGGAVLVRSERPLEYGVSGEERTVLVHLRGADIKRPNDRLPLDTRFFGGVVERVVPLSVPGGIDLRIELRNSAGYQLQQGEGVLSVTFAAVP